MNIKTIGLDLAQKTHRGLEGRVRQGKAAGGLSYGYDLVRTIGRDGLPTTGERTINAVEAAVVRRIFTKFASGDSPRTFCHGAEPGRHPRPEGQDLGAQHDLWQLASGHGHREQRVVCRPDRLEPAALLEGS